MSYGQRKALILPSGRHSKEVLRLPYPLISCGVIGRCGHTLTAAAVAQAVVGLGELRVLAWLRDTNTCKGGQSYICWQYNGPFN